MYPLQQALSPPYRLEGLPVIRDLVYHCQARVLVWPAKGMIYGRAGTPVGGVCADGYVRLGGGRSLHQYAHRVVWESVHGPIPLGMQIDHKNGDRSCNRIGNLDLVSNVENVWRAMDRGIRCTGVPHPNSKLTPDLVCEIRASDRPTRQWARELGADPKTVRLARRRQTWRHVECRGAKPIRHRRGRRKPTPGAAS